MTSPNVYIKSFGCQMNKLDTSLVSSSLAQAGFTLTEDLKSADAVLINTCSVRDHAEQRVYSHIGHLRHLKQTRPHLVVAVFGCMAQRLGSNLLQDSTVDIVCGPAQIPQLPKLVADALSEKTKAIAVTEKIRTNPAAEEIDALEQFESVASSADPDLPAQAFVRVMRGCDKFCSYCVVPYVRGPEVCRPPQLILDQVKTLADRGIKLITFLGQTVNSYHYMAGERTYLLADLLELAGGIEGIEWIRFVTSYPSEKFFAPLMQAMASLPKVCKYLHIPAQSGSDRILKAMNRRYTAAQYLALLDTARSIVPGLAVAGDFIVGFPDETEEEFAATMDLVQKARYKNSFIFKYSPRPSTTADKRLADNIPAEVKKDRNIRLLAVQEEISASLSASFLGKTVRVLVEGPSKKPHLNSADSLRHPQLVARTTEDWIVVFNGPPSLAGRFADVEITKTGPLTLFGRLS